MQDRRVNVGEIELQIREYEGDGQTIIFLHFGGGNLMVWERAVPFFQDKYRLILVDLRGYGRSDKPRTGNHIDQMARDVIGMMDRLGLEQAHLVGSSLGAEVGLSLAANYPERARSLICDGALYSEYGPYGIWEGSEAEFQAHVKETLNQIRNRPEQVFPTIEAFVAKRREMFEKRGWWNPYVEAFTTYDACEIRPGKYGFSCPKWAKVEYQEHYFGYRFEDYYKRVKCPILMVPGEEEFHDERIKQAMLGLSELADQAKIVAVPGWEHPYGWLLDPEAMCETILEFLADK